MVYLESKGIIHRDLAARNILVSNVNGKYSCVVADFGLSRDINEGQEQGSKVPVRWSPPEVLSKMRVTNKVDIWAFAVLIHEVSFLSLIDRLIVGFYKRRAALWQLGIESRSGRVCNDWK